LGALALGYLLLLGSIAQADDLTDQIDARVAALNVIPGTMAPVAEQALKTRQAIVDGDFTTAKRLAAEVLAGSQLQAWRFDPYEDFIADIFVEIPPNLGARLDEWVKSADGSDATPLLLRAQYRYNRGWAERGHSYGDDVLPGRIYAFVDAMRDSEADANAALKLSPGNPYLYYLQLRILAAHGASPDFVAAFEESIGRFPRYYPLYDLMLQTLQPKWGGNIPSMVAFVANTTKDAPQLSPLHLLPLSLARYLLEIGSEQCGLSGGNSDAVTRCTAAFMEQVHMPSDDSRIHDALNLYAQSDQYQFGLAVKRILSDMLSTPGGDAYSAAVLQLAASTMNSDTQLQDENPGHNDYVIDTLVAQSWGRQGFPANQLTKYLEAIADIGNSKSMTDDQRNAARGLIYEDLARAASFQNQYLDEIAFQKAADLVGSPWNNDLICNGFYELKDYAKAAETCTAAIDATSNGNAWYWRGMAYKASGQQDLALADLRRAAGLDEYFASYAVIDMSMIYFGRNDIPGALNVLNAYPLIFDTARTDKSQVAIAYNNRCYALMQLGQLKAALSDCSQSLRYGNLPDALRKQQELTDRLAKQ
jgi:tetratricopeptide (TPR) repeat protein